jgi:hypothetical protein
VRPVKRFSLPAIFLALTVAACSGGGSDRVPSRPAGAPSSVGKALPAPSPAPAPSAHGFLPAPEQAIPGGAPAMAREFVLTTRALHAVIDRWTGHNARPTASPPRDVVLLALHQQQIYRALGRDTPLAARVIPRLPPALRGEARTNVAAIARLASLVGPVHGPVRIRTKPPDPPALLLRSYHEAERRFGVAWSVLAAVNFIESRFGRARSVSSEGAQGPMQFLPSTWAAFGMGGDVQDPHDAVIGAANYLHASGAPGDYQKALFAYNRAQAYVDAVVLYSRRMRQDPRAFFEYYNWQVFVITGHGDRRLTGPGVRSPERG